MSAQLNKKELEKFSRQIILKNIGLTGQKKIKNSKVLIIGVGGLGCPVAEALARAGVGKIGIVDNDLVNLSNIHRQSLFDMTNLNKPKVKIAKLKLKKINSKISVQEYNLRLKKNNFKKIIKKYDYIVDGSDNFETKFLINDFCIKFKKNLVVGAISKFDGHIFSYDFKNKNETCLRCFYQEDSISDDNLNCEFEGVVGTVANIVGNIQANEILKKILNIGTKLNNQILIIDLLNLNFRKIKIKKQMKCKC
jgi:molybdopterin/thiamine biosynthesis adenylyltransferase|tara:strand:- start:1366 stop:2118 length:753 start_codon:yes stop_codon:yes gene_type:complete